MTFLRESVALPVVRSLTHYYALRRITAHAFTTGLSSLALLPLAWLHQGGSRIFEKVLSRLLCDFDHTTLLTR